MTRFAVLALLVGIAGSASAAPQEKEGERAATLKARLERFKQLTPEQKQKLRERVEYMKKLPAEERTRLQENVRRFRQLPAQEQQLVKDRIQKLTPEERKGFADLASGFQHWAQRQGYLESFPREVFFQFLRDQRSDDLAKLKEMEPADRKDKFVKLYFDFRDVSLERFKTHASRHRCNSEEQVKALADSDVRSFWPALRKSWERCDLLKKEIKRPRSDGGPVAPRK
jgi:hypothetical protein